MCHSVEMYMPRLTRQAAEHRLCAADLAATRRERATGAMAARLWTRLRGRAGRIAALLRATPRAIEQVR